MNTERTLTFIYFTLGIFMGVVSLFLDVSIIVGVAAILYAVSFFVFRKMARDKKTSWYITNTLVTFILVWLVTWIFIYNL